MLGHVKSGQVQLGKIKIEQVKLGYIFLVGTGQGDRIQICLTQLYFTQKFIDPLYFITQNIIS